MSSADPDAAGPRRPPIAMPDGPPMPPLAAIAHFGERIELLERYAAILAGPGVIRGLLGPREVPRLWDRHILNCAVAADVPRGGDRVADLGSGAGLPGLVVAALRPELEVVLIESLARRSEFLAEAVAELGLANVSVHRGRAEECRELRGGFDIVLARAVAPLARLLPTALPLLRPGGRLLAFKGASAQDEVGAANEWLRKAAVADVGVRRYRAAYLHEAVTVVEVRTVAGRFVVSRETGG